MIAGSEMIKREIKNTNLIDTVLFKDEWKMEKIGDKIYKKILCGTIIEYDTNKNIVWVWKSSDYFTDADFFSRKNSIGLLNSSTHLNSFDVDEKNNFVYAGFRDVSRIVKISYPSGQVIASYGDNYVPGEKRQGSGFFHAQHNCRISSNGYLYLFNNNAPIKGIDKLQNDIVSSVVVLKEPIMENDSLTKIWEFKCDIDSLANPFGVTGGGVCELKDGAFLTTMGTTNRSFIVGRDKKIYWNALLQMQNGNDTWVPALTYRINPIETQAGLEGIIFRD